MKKLITVALIVSATSLFSENPSPTPPACDCAGVGLPKTATPKITANQASSTAKLQPVSLSDYLFLRAELAWWVYLTM